MSAQIEPRTFHGIRQLFKAIFFPSEKKSAASFIIKRIIPAGISGIEFITPEEDPVEYVEDNLGDPFADDGGVITVPDIPQQHEVSRYGSNYEVEKVMMGKE